MATKPPGNRFSVLLLDGLDHYRKGRMMEAVRAWEEAYLLEPTNLRAREFLRSALERIHAHLAPGAEPVAGLGAAATHAPAPVLSSQAAPPPGSVRSQPPPPAGYADPPIKSREAGPITLATAAWSNSPAPQPAPRALPSARPLPASPWDDGPSVALPFDELSLSKEEEQSQSTWPSSAEPAPVPDASDDDVAMWRRGAGELLALNDFSGALDLAHKILRRHPADEPAQRLRHHCESTLTQMYESKIGDLHARPRVVLLADEIIWLNLDPRAGFVLAQIDGRVTFDDLYAICGLERLDTSRILSQLLEERVITKDPLPPAAPRKQGRPGR